MDGNWTAESRLMCTALCGNKSGRLKLDSRGFEAKGVLKKSRNMFAFKNVQTVVLRKSGEGTKGMCDFMAQERQFCEAG